MTESERERTKLTAAFVSNLALAIIVAGFVAPLAAISLHLATSPRAGGFTILVSLVWLRPAQAYICSHAASSKGCAHDAPASLRPVRAAAHRAFDRYQRAMVDAA